MKIQELRQMTVKKLYEKLLQTRRELNSAKFRTKTGQNQNTAQTTKLRKMIAQIMTILKEMSSVEKETLNTKTSK